MQMGWTVAQGQRIRQGGVPTLTPQPPPPRTSQTCWQGHGASQTYRNVEPSLG